MGCKKLAYYPSFEVLKGGFKKELTLKNSSKNLQRLYFYGFQGQEMDDEVSGEGNSYTAEFWQYSQRIGGRLKFDPVGKHPESPDANFANNPIWIKDPSGADTTFFQEDGSYDLDAKNDFEAVYSDITKMMDN